MERFETETTKRVHRALDRLSQTGGLMLLTGPHGVGKSTAVEMAMAGREEMRRTLVVPSSERVAPRGFYSDIALDLGLATANNLSAAQVARSVTAHVRRHDLTLVLDNAEVMRAGQLDCVRYLADLVPRLVLVGSSALTARLQRHEALRCRVRLPLEAQAVSADELVGFLGGEFSEAWLRATHEETGGLWSGIWTLVEWQRLAGGDTRDAGADAARQAAQTFLVRAA